MSAGDQLALVDRMLATISEQQHRLARERALLQEVRRWLLAGGDPRAVNHLMEQAQEDAR